MQKQITRTLVVFVFLTGCADRRIPDPHQHATDVHARPWSAEMVPDMTLVPIKDASPFRIDIAITNQSGTLRACIALESLSPNTRREHIIIEQLDSGEMLEIRGIPLEHRPFSDLVWIRDRYLIFDRWSQPHYGIHYIIDMKKKRVVAASPCPDIFFLSQEDSENILQMK